ncbi:zinc finger protein, putative [Ixodes scapularis]|uniref:Zinc finger protein, putative n=1 Tax=Ixodes scapularis TaxID=6945 RepID=B7Q104_IXOSC|nr:zinc finger protein, putative [Ixodes scapularis]|eukprot:XP_002408720.1 zinc finger protein, putative [Ixodes scapularis]
MPEQQWEEHPGAAVVRMDHAYWGTVRTPCEEDEGSDLEEWCGDRAERRGPVPCQARLALKHIRALRAKRKDERGPLVCKICKRKVFTAQATLMYHHRSHADIKPFNSKICEATFTRQHSFNIHMLIHNNKSRFACEDCGRHFRHPSHFKEHLRRHTRKTPYQCTDCSQRCNFKGCSLGTP